MIKYLISGLLALVVSIGGFFGVQQVNQNFGAFVPLSVPAGGTGWGNITSGTLLTGNGTGKIATTSVGSGLTLAGNVLSATGGGGTGSNWLFTAAQDAITPSTTVGVILRASSTLSHLGSGGVGANNGRLYAGATTTYNSPLNYANGAVTLSTSGAWSGTAGALAADGGNCSAGNFPLGVDTLGAVQTCTDAWTEAENTSAAYISDGNTNWDNSYGFTTFAWPFTPDTNFGATAQATTGIPWFKNGLQASSTSYFTQASTTQLTVLGTATSTFNGPITLTGLNDHITVHGLRSDASDGLHIEANNWTDVASLGVGNTANATFYGGVNIDGTTRLATSLTGLLKATSGTVSTATAGTDYITPSGLASAYPFTATSYGNSTSTTIGFLNGLFSVGSTTISGLTSGLIGNNNGLLYGFASSSLFGYTPLNPTRNINTTYPVQGGGDLSADRTISLAFGTTTNNTWSGLNLFTAASTTIVGNATTTGYFFAGTASSSLLFGAGLFECSDAGDTLNWNAGVFTCGTDSEGAGGSFPFTAQSYGNSTSTVIAFLAGLVSNGSTTVSSLSSGIVGNNNGLLYSVASSSLFGTATAGQVWGYNSAGTWGAVSTTTFVAGTNVTLSLAGNALTINSTGGGSAFAWTPFTWGNSTSTVLSFPGFISTASSTISYLGTGGTASNNGRLYNAATTTFSGGLSYSAGNVTDVLTAGVGLTRTTNDFACDTASGSVFGCLTSTDWNTFNGKAGFAWPFELGNTNFATTTNSTSTPIWFKMGIFASSTSRFATTTISNLLLGTATTTKQSTGGGGPESIGIQRTNANDLILYSGITNEVEGRFLVETNGLMGWGAGGTSDQDINFYRNAVGNLTVQSFVSSSSQTFRVNDTTGTSIFSVDTNSGFITTPKIAVNGAGGGAFVDVVGDGNTAIRAKQPNSSDASFGTFVTGDSNLRFGFLASGALQWGSGTGGYDSILYRNAASELKTDDGLVIALGATTTNLSVTGSSTLATLFGAGLSTCDATTGKITWAAGVFGCGTDFNTGGGGGSGNVATSTTETAGQLAFWTSTGATPATLGGIATGTISATSPLTVTAGRSAIGGAAAFAITANGITNTELAFDTGQALTTTSSPTFNALTLTTDLTVANGGTGASTLTGLLQGNGTGAITGITGTAGQFPYYNGASTLLATSTLFLATNGLLGVGTTTPAWPFTVFSATQPQIALSAGAGVAQWTMRNAGGNLYFSTTTVAGTATSTPAALTINNSGKGLFIGTTTNAAVTGLAVVGTIYSTGLSASTAGNALCQLTNGEWVNAGANTCLTSSARFKHDIQDLTLGLNIILELHPRSFTRNEPSPSQPTGKEVGLIAEEVQMIAPVLVEYEADGKTPRGVNYMEFTAVLTKAVQELNTKVENITGEAAKSVQDRWQWLCIGILFFLVGWQQLQIRRLRTIISPRGRSD